MRLRRRETIRADIGLSGFPSHPPGRRPSSRWEVLFSDKPRQRVASPLAGSLEFLASARAGLHNLPGSHLRPTHAETSMASVPRAVLVVGLVLAVAATKAAEPTV